MKGLDRVTGLELEGRAYLVDRIQSCLSMRIGTHPMRRLKGSKIPALLDRPLNENTLFEMKIAALDALASPQNGFADLDVVQVAIDQVGAGKITLTVSIFSRGETLPLTGIEIVK